MNLLLDTHIWIWTSLHPGKISRRVSSMIENAHNSLWISALSIHECGVQSARARVKLKPGFRQWVEQELSGTRLQVAVIDREIAMEAASLPIGISDPIDRFIVATAIVHDYTLITADRRILDAKACRSIET